MNTVVNVRKSFSFDIYVGREHRYHKGSPFQNPFHSGVGLTREDAIEKYAVYFYSSENKPLRDLALKIIPDGASLGCWCAPKRCHADLIAGYLEYKRKCTV